MTLYKSDFYSERTQNKLEETNVVDYISAMNVGGKLSQIIPFCKRHLADGLWEPEKAVSFGILVWEEASSLAFTANHR